MPTTIALLHPGEMGAAVGECLVHQGHRVIWVATGRSPATRERATTAGLQPASSLAQALAVAHVVVSVCPPHAALTLAQHVASFNFRGLYLDANAIAPETMRAITQVFSGLDTRVVDGGIIGLPPRQPGSTRLYLSGPGADEASALFGDGALAAPVIEGPAGAASALKMCYAAYTKGLTALLTNIRALASHEQVEPALLAEWALSQPEVEGRSLSIEQQARKAWRWVGEMQEIADTFQAAGLPDGFHRASAEIYERLSRFKDAPAAPITEVLHTIRQAPNP